MSTSATCTQIASDNRGNPQMITLFLFLTFGVPPKPIYVVVRCDDTVNSYPIIAQRYVYPDRELRVYASRCNAA